jgi:hypothetical protein
MENTDIRTRRRGIGQVPGVREAGTKMSKILEPGIAIEGGGGAPRRTQITAGTVEIGIEVHRETEEKRGTVTGRTDLVHVPVLVPRENIGLRNHGVATDHPSGGYLHRREQIQNGLIDHIAAHALLG